MKTSNLSPLSGVGSHLKLLVEVWMVGLWKLAQEVFEVLSLAWIGLAEISVAHGLVT